MVVIERLEKGSEDLKWQEYDNHLGFRECAGMLEGEGCGHTAGRWGYRWIRGRVWVIQPRRL